MIRSPGYDEPRVGIEQNRSDRSLNASLICTHSEGFATVYQSAKHLVTAIYERPETPSGPIGNRGARQPSGASTFGSQGASALPR